MKRKKQKTSGRFRKLTYQLAMRRSHLRSLLFAFLTFLVILAFPRAGDIANWEQPVQAFETGSIPTLSYSNGEQQLVAPDWSRLTFSALPPVEEPGWIEIPAKLASQLGYDPSRVWKAGARAEEILMLGDLQEAFHLETLTLQSIADITNLNLETLALSAFELVGHQTIGDLVQTIPELGELSVAQVKPFADLLAKVGGGSSWEEKLFTVAQDQVLGKLPLGKYLDLSKYSLDTIPNLVKTPLRSFRAWQQSSISGVLGNQGLASLPFSQFPLPLLNGAIKVAKVDTVWGTAEHEDPKVPASQFISGAVNKQNRTVPVPCTTGKPCPCIELSDPMGANGPLHGKRWVAGGKDGMKVKGGFGPLRGLNGGWEPTGLLVYGSAFKVVLLDTTESDGTARFGLYFRVCVNTPFYGKSCSPYFIGPVPWLPTKEKGLVVVASTAFGLY